eukprot:GILK01010269.1.p1 GENE.GILK01010269.1~~GILK01010269.1.p1  ORF type:complete len:856 (+),score=112.04 GILK01010269.1:133-2700(+)
MPTRCVCGEEHDCSKITRAECPKCRDQQMVQCEDCKTWQHARCVEYKTTRRALNGKYLCPSCRGESADRSNASSSVSSNSGTPKVPKVVKAGRLGKRVVYDSPCHICHHRKDKVLVCCPIASHAFCEAHVQKLLGDTSVAIMDILKRTDVWKVCPVCVGPECPCASCQRAANGLPRASRPSKRNKLLGVQIDQMPLNKIYEMDGPWEKMGLPPVPLPIPIEFLHEIAHLDEDQQIQYLTSHYYKESQTSFGKAKPKKGTLLSSCGTCRKPLERVVDETGQPDFLDILGARFHNVDECSNKIGSIPRVIVKETDDIHSTAFADQVLSQDVVIIEGALDFDCLNIDHSLFSANNFSTQRGAESVDILVQAKGAIGWELGSRVFRRRQALRDYVQYFNQFDEDPNGRQHHKVQYCSNVDMDRWDVHLKELSSKIPEWMWCTSKLDILRLLRQPIKGVNYPQAHLRVPGAWHGAHEEHNRFRAVNCSFGPDDSEWGVILPQNLPKLRRKVQEHFGLDIYQTEGTYIPDVRWCLEQGIPVLRGIQSKNDIMLLGVGCLYWVRALGKTIQTTWNFGLADYNQFLHAFERYDINMEVGKQSSIPLKTLALDLMMSAKQNDALKSMDPRLMNLLHQRLERSLREEEMIASALARGVLEDNLLIMTENPSMSKVSACAMSGCRREIVHFYMHCPQCDLQKDKLDRKAKKRRTKSLRLSSVFCFYCAQEHKRSHPKHSLTAYQKGSLDDLVKYFHALTEDVANINKIVSANVLTALASSMSQPTQNPLAAFTNPSSFTATPSSLAFPLSMLAELSASNFVPSANQDQPEADDSDDSSSEDNMPSRKHSMESVDSSQSDDKMDQSQ